MLLLWLSSVVRDYFNKGTGEKAFCSTLLLIFSVVGVGKFSSTIVADLVHDLVKLASLLTNVGDDRARVVESEVANCLGEIGAVDLSTVSLGSKKRGMIRHTSVKWP